MDYVLTIENSHSRMERRFASQTELNSAKKALKEHMPSALMTESTRPPTWHNDKKGGRKQKYASKQEAVDDVAV